MTVLIGCEAVIETPGEPPLVAADLFPTAAAAWAFLAAWRGDEVDEGDGTLRQLRVLATPEACPGVVYGSDPAAISGPWTGYRVRDIVAEVLR